MVLLKCARENTRFYHTKATRIYTLPDLYYTYIYIHTQKRTYKYTCLRECGNLLLTPLSPSLFLAYSLKHAHTHTHAQTFKLDVLFSFKSSLASKRASKVSLSLSVYVCMCSLPCIREHYFVFCWLFGDLFIAYG